MSKSVTVNFEDGTSHVYDDVPDDVSDQDVQARASQDFGKNIAGMKAAPAAAPAEAGPGAPQMGDYMMMNKDLGQAVGAAQVPFQIAAEHPFHTGGLASATYLGKRYLDQQLTQQAAQQAAQQAVRPMAAPGPVAPTPAPAPAPQLLDAQGRPIQAAPRPVAPVAPVAPAAAAAPAEQGLASGVRQAAASRIAGLVQASPMLATAGRVAGKVLPGAATALGGLDTYNRFKEGDYLGAGISGAGTVASLFPGVGTGISLGAQGINAGRDMSRYLEAKRQYEEQQKRRAMK